MSRHRYPAALAALLIAFWAGDQLVSTSARTPEPGPVEVRPDVRRVAGPMDPTPRSPRQLVERDVGERNVAASARLALAAAVALRSPTAYGAGVLVDDRGLVLTVAHVVGPQAAAPPSGPPPRLRAALAGQPWQDAQLVARDDELDLALLRLGAPVPTTHRAARIGSVVDCRAGDPVLTIGSPRQLDFSVARGIVAHVGRRFGRVRYLQTDLPITSGNSGGPVFDEAGRVVGLMSFIVRDGERLAFALPIDYAMERLARWLPQGEPERQQAFARWRQDSLSSPF